MKKNECAVIGCENILAENGGVFCDKCENDPNYLSKPRVIKTPAFGRSSKQTKYPGLNIFGPASTAIASRKTRK